MKRWLILLTAGCLAFAGVANAAVQQGDTELDFLGGWMSQNAADGGADVSSLFLMGRLGYFVTDNVQISAAAFGSWNKFEMDGQYVLYADVDEEYGIKADVDLDMYGLGAGVKYHFMPTNQLVPYIGAQVLWVDADVDATITEYDTYDSGEGMVTDVTRSSESGDADGLLWGPIAGVRYELNAYNDFFVEYQYHIWSGDIDDILDDGHLLFVGLIHQFK